MPPSVPSPGLPPRTPILATLDVWYRSHPREVWVLFLGNLCSSMGTAFYFPMLTIFLRERLSIGMAWIGTLFLISGLVGAIGSWLGGEWSDRVGRKPVMIFALAGRGVTAAAMAVLAWLHPAPAPVALVLILSSFMGHFFNPACDAYMADVLPEHRRVQGYGLIRVARNVGWALGPLMSGLLALISYPLLFLVTACAMAIGAGVIRTLTKEPGSPQPGRRFRWRDLSAIAGDRAFMAYSAGCVLLFTVMAQLITTLSDWSLEHARITKPEMGIVYAINGTIVVLFQIPVARFLSRLRLTSALILGAAVYALAYGSMAFARTFPAIAGLMIGITLAEIIVAPSTVTLAANLSPHEARGRYMGVFGLFHQLGWSLGPWIGGMALEGFAPHPERTWYLLGGIGWASVVAFLALRPRIQASADRPEADPPIPVPGAARAPAPP